MALAGHAQATVDLGIPNGHIPDRVERMGPRSKMASSSGDHPRLVFRVLQVLANRYVAASPSQHEDPPRQGVPSSYSPPGSVRPDEDVASYSMRLVPWLHSVAEQPGGLARLHPYMFLLQGLQQPLAQCLRKRLVGRDTSQLGFHAVLEVAIEVEQSVLSAKAQIHALELQHRALHAWLGADPTFASFFPGRAAHEQHVQQTALQQPFLDLVAPQPHDGQPHQLTLQEAACLTPSASLNFPPVFMPV